MVIVLNLEAEMVRNKISRSDIAKLLGLTLVPELYVGKYDEKFVNGDMRSALKSETPISKTRLWNTYSRSNSREKA